MDKMVWIVNKGSKDFERTDTDLKKHLIIKPLRPMQLPFNIAKRYVKFTNIFFCEHPERYFEDSPLNRLIIRDAGIGDLLLLEPILRKMKVNGDNINVLTRFPDVYKANPHIFDVITAQDKNDLPVKVDDYDMFQDLRNYSETCNGRDKEHRTDCYNQLFKLDMSPVDKEPRIYFEKDEPSYLNKKKGRVYIGLALDGSHYFRRYSYGKDLINRILNYIPNAEIVLIGDGWEDGQGYVKIKKTRHVNDLQGKTSIRQMFSIVKNLDYLVAMDSGIMHVGMTMHIPTVGIFSIIHPELRVEYYTGQYRIIGKTDLNCFGCGSWHMAKCIHVDQFNDKGAVPPCLRIEPKDIVGKIQDMSIEKDKRIFINSAQQPEKDTTVNVNRISSKKITMPIIVQNEAKNLPRFIELVMNHPSIGRVIAIDGGSDDNTRELLEKAGAEVYVHPYNKDYHDMQALQRNISFSYVPDGTKCIMMDIDECFSDELRDWLPTFAESNIIYGVLSRRTFDFFSDIHNPTKQIKDYPDFQPRLFTWDRKFKWVGSPHHNVYNVPGPVKIKKDIIHFEKEGKDRDALEKKWSAMQKKTQEIYK